MLTNKAQLAVHPKQVKSPSAQPTDERSHERRPATPRLCESRRNPASAIGTAAIASRATVCDSTNTRNGVAAPPRVHAVRSSISWSKKVALAITAPAATKATNSRGLAQAHRIVGVISEPGKGIRGPVVAGDAIHPGAQPEHPFTIFIDGRNLGGVVRIIEIVCEAFRPWVETVETVPGAEP